jgi:hypothetical protein
VRCLFIHLLHNTSLIFPHSHLLCWGTCLGTKSISQNPVHRRWDPDHTAVFAAHAWHQHVIRIAWHEDVFSCWGRDESPKVPDPGSWAGAQEFPSPNTDCTSSCVRKHTVQYPLRNCIVHENCGAWARKVPLSSDQCLNFNLLVLELFF